MEKNQKRTGQICLAALTNYLQTEYLQSSMVLLSRIDCVLSTLKLVSFTVETDTRSHSTRSTTRRGINMHAYPFQKRISGLEWYSDSR